MINWIAVAAFIGPLVAALGLVATWYAYLSRQREKRVNIQITQVTGKFEANQVLLQARIDQVEVAIQLNAHQLEKQNDTLLTALQAIARIEGRLASVTGVTRDGTTG